MVAVVVLLVVRHMLTLADNIRLTGHLEDLVRVRTDDLEQPSRRHLVYALSDAGDADRRGRGRGGAAHRPP